MTAYNVGTGPIFSLVYVVLCFVCADVAVTSLSASYSYFTVKLQLRTL